MNPILGAALEVEAACRRARFDFCFIGGVAVQRWGEPRLTQDVDLTLLTGVGGEARFVDEILRHFGARLPDAREFALLNRVLLVHASNGVPIDVSLGAMPFEERTIERSSAFSIGGGETITTCSAEDLVVHKAFAGRDKDWLDIRGVLVRRGAQLALEIVWAELLPLLELRDDVTTEPRVRRLVLEAAGR